MARNRQRSAALTAVVATLGIVLTADPSHAIRFQQRPDWRVGLGWGFGRGTFEDPAGDQAQYRSGSAPQLRFGRMLGSRLMAGIDYEAWVIEFGDIPTKYRRGLQNLMASIDVFPGNPDGASGGIFLRFAGGMGWSGSAEVPVAVGEAQQHGERIDEWGWGAAFGAGYEFWVAPNFTVGAAAAINYFDLDERIVDRAGFSALVLDLNLYF
jgi:hypothetical protein